MSACSRRSFLLAAAATLAGCATGDGMVAGGSGPAADAPVYRVGDRWTYRAQDGYRSPVVWDETQEVIAVGPEGIRVRITQKGPTVDNVREEIWAAPGLVAQGALLDAETRRFAGTLKRYEFPLAPGKQWNQRIANYNEALKRDGEITRWVRVGTWSSMSTPAGTVDVIQLRVSMRLDDNEFWRQATECNYVTWYAPAVRNFVREVRDAQYIDGTGRDAAMIRSQHAILELVSFVPG